MKIRKVVGWGLVASPIITTFVAMAIDKGVAFALLVAAGVVVTGSVVVAGCYLALKEDERKSRGG